MELKYSKLTELQKKGSIYYFTKHTPSPTPLLHPLLSHSRNTLFFLLNFTLLIY